MGFKVVLVLMVAWLAQVSVAVTAKEGEKASDTPVEAVDEEPQRDKRHFFPSNRFQWDGPPPPHWGGPPPRWDDRPWQGRTGGSPINTDALHSQLPDVVDTAPHGARPGIPRFADPGHRYPGWNQHGFYPYPYPPYPHPYSYPPPPSPYFHPGYDCPYPYAHRHPFRPGTFPRGQLDGTQDVSGHGFGTESGKRPSDSSFTSDFSAAQDTGSPSGSGAATDSQVGASSFSPSFQGRSGNTRFGSGMDRNTFPRNQFGGANGGYSGGSSLLHGGESSFTGGSPFGGANSFGGDTFGSNIPSTFGGGSPSSPFNTGSGADISPHFGAGSPDSPTGFRPGQPSLSNGKPFGGTAGSDDTLSSPLGGSGSFLGAGSPVGGISGSKNEIKARDTEAASLSSDQNSKKAEKSVVLG